MQNPIQNDLRAEDRSVHRWYRFVLSFPPHLVRDYLNRFAVTADQSVLDPFCGTGTTPVECKKLGIRAVGLEATPMAHFASQVMIRTGQILGRIAETLGYQCESIDLFRTRLSTVTGEQLREEVVVLRWPGLR